MSIHDEDRDGRRRHEREPGDGDGGKDHGAAPGKGSRTPGAGPADPRRIVLRKLEDARTRIRDVRRQLRAGAKVEAAIEGIDRVLEEARLLVTVLDLEGASELVEDVEHERDAVRTEAAQVEAHAPREDGVVEDERAAFAPHLYPAPAPATIDKPPEWEDTRATLDL